jgi:hypothetical protein
MPTPKEILAVPRPKNTIVVVYGKHRDHYAVRQRTGCRYVGGRHVPVTGPTIGHIAGGAYVPLPDRPPVAQREVELKDWAAIELADRCFEDVFEELRRVYCEADARRIWCIALLRVCYPGIPDRELKERYDASFLSEKYPGVALSRNAVCKFQNDLGKSCSRIIDFMRNRAATVGADAHLLLDGTLKSDESRVNSLSDFSRKARTKGSRDISVLYAFDLEAQEPVCSKCFPGNMLDVTAYGAFMEECGIENGLVVADKGFPASAAAGYRSRHPGLHYLNPVKRNARFIQTHRMLDFDSPLPGREGVLCRKAHCRGEGKWLYSFRDAEKAAAEERSWLAKASAKKTYNQAEFERRRRQFGTIVLECDLDLPPETVYKAYEERWQIEIVMRYYKNACGFDETRVQDDWSVIGSEFCDFLATVLTFRLLKAFDRAGLLKKETYSRLLSVLRRAKQVRWPDGDGWHHVKLAPSQETVLRALSLLPSPPPPPPRKRGRPRKSPQAAPSSTV